MINRYFIIVIFITAFIIPREYSIYFFPFAILYFYFLDKKLLGFLFKRSFLLIVLILLLLQPLFTGEKDILFAGIKLSSEGFYNGIFMMFRAAVVIPSISYLSRSIEIKKMQKLFSRIGIKNYDEVFIHSQQIFPILKEKTKEYFTLHRKKIINPIEFCAQFVAILIRTTQSHLINSKEDEAL
ncbi:MAG: hypothetical protein WCZ90_18050 [Melioribacteraceae bacterium]